MLTPGKVYVGGQVAVNAAGIIQCVGCDCEAMATGATRITCANGVISPGLINMHDHIGFTQNAPFNNTGERYEHRHEWRRGLRGHTRIPAAGGATADHVRWGELRFVMGGATATISEGGQTGFLRNLDSNQQEGLGKPAVQSETFPLDDSTPVFQDGTCNYGDSPDTAASISREAYISHVGEGVDVQTRNEFLCASSATFDTTAPGTSQDLAVAQAGFVHSTGLRADDYSIMARDGTALIWSPRSNICLYGNTAQVTAAHRLGVLIALGTDWTPTGSVNMLRELRCVDELNTTYYNRTFSDEDMWRMVTYNAAVSMNRDDVLGVLATGRQADIAIFNGATRTQFRAVVGAEMQDVVLVMRGGKTLYGDDAAVAALAQNCDPVMVCGSGKRVCATSEIAKSYSALQSAAGSAYGAIWCGTPTNEPTCVPSRPRAVNNSTIYTGAPSATDNDGDGVPNTTDNCPNVFNPVRPLDNGTQGDFDTDGAGDACDPCPVNANTTTCAPINSDDADGDGRPNLTDNCPTTPNMDQADMDMDGKGNVCDACPMVANPGNAACPANIHAIKMGTVMPGTVVSLQNVLVTGKGGIGFFVQAITGDPGYTGVDNSGLFVFTGTNSPNNVATPGQRVDIAAATVANFSGQIQLNGVTSVTVRPGAAETLPTPVDVTVAQVATGGARAAALEGVTVHLTDGAFTVTSVNAMFNEFRLNDAINVDDLLYLPVPFPAVNDALTDVTGILGLRFMDSKLNPRSANDLLSGPPRLRALTPASSFVREGQADVPAFPTAITVDMSRAVTVDTVVTVASSNDLVASVVGGNVTVLAGQSSAVVRLNGVMPGSVTLTATLGTDMATTTLNVLGAAQPSAVVALEPGTVTMRPGATQTFTVVLDVPAAADTMVALSQVPAAAGTLPVMVTIPVNALGVTFDYVDGMMAPSVVLTATLNTSMASSTVTITDTTTDHLVINELDYNQAGTDAASYIELYNGTGAAVDLTELAVVLINGATGQPEYARFALASAGTSLPHDRYLVIANAGVLAPLGPDVLKITATGDFIQNGPDGVALINTATTTLVDALSYGGTVSMANIQGFSAAVNLVEGARFTSSDTGDDTTSLSRGPNGADTGDAAADWRLTTQKTPGAANPAP